MHIIYLLGLIFLAAYLIIAGAVAVFGLTTSPLIVALTGLIAIAAGVLLLISLGGHSRRK